jgi:hypothetical protein
MWSTLLASVMLVGGALPADVARSAAPYLLPDDLVIVQLELSDRTARIIDQLASESASADEWRTLHAYIQPYVELGNSLRQQNVIRVFLVVSPQQFVGGAPTVIVSLEPATDVQAVIRQLESLGAVELMDRGGQPAAVLAPPERLAAIQRAGGKWDRSEQLARALSSLDEAPVKGVILCEELMRTLRELRPDTPEGIDVTSVQLAASLESIGVALVPTPNDVALRMTIQAEDSAAAVTLQRAVEQTAARTVEKLQPLMGDRDLSSLVSLCMPKPEGDRLVRELPNVFATLRQPQWQGLATLVTGTVTHARSMNQIKQLVLATVQFEVKYGGLPPAASYDDQGRPLLSWRVHLLPFLGENLLYDRFRLDEPWDSPHNRRLVSEMPAVYQSRGLASRAAGRTGYLAPIGPTCMFFGRSGLSYKDVPDGTSKTILYVEAIPDRAVIWTKPEDWQVDLAKPLEVLNWPGELGFIYGRVDGSGHRQTLPMEEERMRRLLQRNDGQLVK